MQTLEYQTCKASPGLLSAFAAGSLGLEVAAESASVDHQKVSSCQHEVSQPARHPEVAVGVEVADCSVSAGMADSSWFRLVVSTLLHRLTFLHS